MLRAACSAPATVIVELERSAKIMIPLFLALIGFGFLWFSFAYIRNTRKFIQRSTRIKAVISEYKDTGIATDGARIRAIVKLGSDDKSYLVSNLSNFYGDKIGCEITVYRNPDCEYVLVDGVFALWGPAIVLFVISLLPLVFFFILIRK